MILAIERARHRDRAIGRLDRQPRVTAFDRLVSLGIPVEHPEFGIAAERDARGRVVFRDESVVDEDALGEEAGVAVEVAGLSAECGPQLGHRRSEFVRLAVDSLVFRVGNVS